MKKIALYMLLLGNIALGVNKEYVGRIVGFGHSQLYSKAVVVDDEGEFSTILLKDSVLVGDNYDLIGSKVFKDLHKKTGHKYIIESGTL